MNILLSSEAVTASMEVAKGIHEYGVAVIICSVFIILSVTLMITCFKWFKSIIENIMNNYSKQIQALHEISNKNGEILVDIAEGLIPETILRVQTILGLVMDVSFHKSRDLVVRVKEENNISNKEGTKKKIRALVQNLFDDMVTKLEYYTFRGKALSSYIDHEDYIDSVSHIIENEVYQDLNPDRTYTNIKMVYDNIKLEMYHRLNNRKNL